MALLISVATSLAQTSPATTLKDKLDAEAQKEIANGQALGITIAVVEDGKLLLSAQYGLKSMHDAKPVRPDTEFPIGSVSKQFTAACVLLLAEDGKLSLDDPVSKYFPDLNRAKDIKVRDLLNHTSGYSDWYPLDFVDARLERPTRSSVVRETYGALPLDFEPALHFSYSNTGYLIAAEIVEKASGKRFFDYLEKRILKPLGMKHTHEYRLHGDDLVGRYTSFFGGPLEAAPLESPGWLLGAGGLTSTAEDLARWDIALMDGHVMSQTSWDQMISPRTLTGGAVSPYGFGQFLSHMRGHVSVSHQGAVSGSITANTMVPDRKSAFIIIGNYDLVPFGPFSSILRDAIVPDEIPNVNTSRPRDSSPSIEVAGPSPIDAAKQLYTQILADKVDRSNLTAECSAYLSEEAIRSASTRLNEMGPPIAVSLLGTDERGEMQVAVLLFQFKTKAYRVLMYRHKDGKIAEFMVAS